VQAKGLAASSLLFFCARGRRKFELLARASAQNVLAALSLVKCLARHDTVDLGEDVLEGQFDVAGVQGGGLDEREVVFT
jgi:hypothetical protein